MSETKHEIIWTQAERDSLRARLAEQVATYKSRYVQYPLQCDDLEGFCDDMDALETENARLTEIIALAQVGWKVHAGQREYFCSINDKYWYEGSRLRTFDTDRQAWEAIRETVGKEQGQG